MGRASIALGAPDSGSGFLDECVSGKIAFKAERHRDSAFNADPNGRVLCASTSGATFEEKASLEAQQEVTLHQLWFQLSGEQRVEFGSCFSRMLLNCLTGTQQEKEMEI